MNLTAKGTSLDHGGRHAMSTEQFWTIIESTRASTGKKQLVLFTKKLKRLSVQRLIGFYRIFMERVFAAYDFDLWTVAWLCRGCGDDGFEYFRYWLISRGRAIYEAAMTQPDTLADEMRRANGIEFELFGYVPLETYEQLTGESMPRPGIKASKQPRGGGWILPKLKRRKARTMWDSFYEMNHQKSILSKRFPNIWARCARKEITNSLN